MLNNPIESYRKTQRELRREFESFTRTHCPNCPTPCCVKPARLELVDIRIAERTGWKSTIPANGSDSDEVIIDPPGPIAVDDETGDLVREPCGFLKPTGCSFPADLMPFGCTAYICKYMHEDMNRAQLNKIKRLVRQMEDQYRMVLKGAEKR